MAANGPLLTLQWLPYRVRQSPKAFQSLKYRGTSAGLDYKLTSHTVSPEAVQCKDFVQLLPKSNMGTEWLACTNPPLYSDLDSKASKAYPSL